MNEKIENYIYLLMTDREDGPLASFFKYILFLASMLYLAAIKVISIMRHYGLIRTVCLDIKLISIGNITWGGTGKTPLVEAVSRIFFEKNRKVAILTRGYKLLPATDKKFQKQTSPSYVADEVMLLHRNIPGVTILVGPDRIKNAKNAMYNYGADILILDDGFQYWELSREMDIVLIDVTNPFGNEMLIPRGILREPIANLSRANIIVITKVNVVSADQVEALKFRIKLLSPNALIATSIHKPVKVSLFATSEDASMSPYKQNVDLPLDWLKDKEFVAVCGIGDPDYFIKTLGSLGAVVKSALFYRDHHPYSFNDLAVISSKCQEVSVKRVITTEKDMVKLRELIIEHATTFKSIDLEFLVLGIQLELIENKDKFIERLVTK